MIASTKRSDMTMDSRATVRSNQEWLQALKSRGPDAEAAQRDLADLARRAISRLAGRYSQILVEDLAQVAVLRILEKLDRFEGRSQFATWAFAVAIRSALTEIRRDRNATARIDSVLDGSEEGSGGLDPSSPLERTEIVKILHRVIAEELTDKQRAAILGELHGTSPAALSEELGIKRNALYKLGFDARHKLREALEKEGVSDRDVRDAFDL